MHNISGKNDDTKIVNSIIENLNNKSADHNNFPKHVDRKLRGPLVNRIETYQMPYMMRSGRNYGEYCTDFIEQNALELYLLGRLDDNMGIGIKALKQKIEDRNPNTKIFAQGIVKLASHEKKRIDGEEVVSSIMDKVNLLRERRDYGIPKKKQKRKNLQK